MNTTSTSPLRQRMIEDMTIRGLVTGMTIAVPFEPAARFRSAAYGETIRDRGTGST